MKETNYQKLRPFIYYDYIDGATLVGAEHYPMLKPTQLVPNKVVSFGERSLIRNPGDYFIDHFVDDFKFESVWRNCDRYIDKYKRFKGVITTDYSVYRDMPLWERKRNVGRNRSIAYYLQKSGIDIIPVASWAYMEDFEWCLDGIPIGSSVAISTNGCMRNFVSRNVLFDGIEALQRLLHPTHLIIAGGPLRSIDEKYENIYYYKNFSQRLAERRKNGR